MKEFKVRKWSPELDLSQFYNEAVQRGFENNASQQMLIDCFRREREWAVWIVYRNDQAVASFAAHSLDHLPGYRICARTCAFTDLLPINNMRTKYGIINHQHITAQIFMPVSIDHFGRNQHYYISTHPSAVGTQRAVHSIWAPLLEKKGVIALETVCEYRGHEQHFWKLDVDKFLEELVPMKMFEYDLV